MNLALSLANGEIRPHVIDKEQPIESIGLRLIVFAYGPTFVGLNAVNM